MKCRSSSFESLGDMWRNSQGELPLRPCFLYFLGYWVLVRFPPCTLNCSKRPLSLSFLDFCGKSLVIFWQWFISSRSWWIWTPTPCDFSNPYYSGSWCLIFARGWDNSVGAADYYCNRSMIGTPVMPPIICFSKMYHNNFTTVDVDCCTWELRPSIAC